MKIFNVNCPVCLGEGKLVKIGDFGDLIYKECSYCNGNKKINWFDKDDKFEIQRSILKNAKGRFSPINGEWAERSDMFRTLYARKCK